MQLKQKVDLTALNEQQREAVEFIEGPLLIAAGPGSGKTRTIVYRTLYMIQEKGIDPKEILLITFTRKAANEMKQRINSLLNLKELPFIGTFHSLCLHILRNYSFKLSIPKDFKVYDPADQLTLLQKLSKDAKKKSLQDILKRISYLKNHLILPSDAPAELQEPYRQYQAYLKEENALDFDDLILKTVQLLKKYPEVHRTLPWKYISVDEYQDTNKAQYELIKLLAKGNQNLCVIGDADQAIYAFRGANIQNFLNFGDDFPEVKLTQLEQNYRSAPEIIKSSESVIQKNEDRMQRKLWTQKKEGKPVIICNAEDEKAEADYIVRTIEMHIGGTSHFEIETKNVDDETSGYKFSDFAVLYRTHLQGKALEEAFLKSGIPYQVIGAVPFYDRAEIKDILSYLRSIYDPNDYAAVLRIINKPVRGIGEATIDKIESHAKNEGIPFYQACQEVDALPLKDEQKNSIANFVKLIESIRLQSTSLKLSELIRSIYEKVEFFNLYKDKKRQDHLYELLGFAVQFDELPPFQGLKAFLQETVFLSDKDIYDEKKEAVTLLTIHASKGLEFPVLFISGVEEKLIPYKHLDEPLNENEERRLFYVGMTRAKDELHLIYTSNRNLFGEKLNSKPSRFVNDIPKDLIREKKHERKKRIKKKKSDIPDSQLALW